MTYVQKESQTNQPSLQKTKSKSAICDSQQKQYRFPKAVKYQFLNTQRGAKVPSLLRHSEQAKLPL